MDNLEQTLPQTEATEQVSETEPEQQVSTEQEAVSDTEQGAETGESQPSDVAEQIKNAIEEARRDWQSSKDKELKTLYDRLADTEKRENDASLKATEQREIEEYGDTKEVRDFQQERRNLQKRAQDQAQKEAQYQTTLEQAAIETKRNMALKLSTEKGIDTNKLLEAETPEQMEVIALRLENEKLREPKKTPQVIDSGVTTSANTSWRELSADEKMRKGVEKL